MASINERSTLPVTWFAIVLFALSGTLITGTFWVSRVNLQMDETNKRLLRIEEALGLYTPRIPDRNVATASGR